MHLVSAPYNIILLGITLIVYHIPIMSFFIGGACIVSELSAQGGVNEKTQHKYANIKKNTKI